MIIINNQVLIKNKIINGKQEQQQQCHKIRVENTERVYSLQGDKDIKDYHSDCVSENKNYSSDSFFNNDYENIYSTKSFMNQSNSVESNLNSIISKSNSNDLNYNVYAVNCTNPTNCPRVEMSIGNQSMNMGPNTKSSINAITLETYNSLNAKPVLLSNDSLCYSYESSKPMNSTGKYEAELTVNNRSIVIEIMKFCLMPFREEV